MVKESNQPIVPTYSIADYRKKFSYIKVSIGIVTYCSSKDILNCLESIYKYTDLKKIDLDIYIFDNLSPESSKTRADIRSYYPQVKLIESKNNYGFAYGHNQIINQIKSDYHLALNADVEFKEDTLSKLVSYLSTNTETVLISPEIRNRDGSIQYLPKRFPKLRYVLSSTIPFFAKHRVTYTRSNEVIDKPTSMEVCTGCFMLCKTETLKIVKGFDQGFFLYFEDLDLALRMGKLGKVMYYPQTYVVHGWFRGPRHSFKLLAIQIKSMGRFYRKWGIIL